MSRTIKSNPDYTRLAYKKTVLQDIVCYLTTNFTAAYGDAPKKLRCEEVFGDEAEVPESFISEFIADWNRNLHRLEDELTTFDFGKRKVHDEEQHEASGKPSPQGKADAGKHGNHRQGRARKGPAPAQ